MIGQYWHVSSTMLSIAQHIQLNHQPEKFASNFDQPSPSHLVPPWRCGPETLTPGHFYALFGDQRYNLNKSLPSFCKSNLAMILYLDLLVLQLGPVGKPPHPLCASERRYCHLGAWRLWTRSRFGSGKVFSWIGWLVKVQTKLTKLWFSRPLMLNGYWRWSFHFRWSFQLLCHNSCTHCWVDPQGPSPPPKKAWYLASSKDNLSISGFVPGWSSWRSPFWVSTHFQSFSNEPTISISFYVSMSNCKILINFAVSNPWRRGSYWVGQGQGRWAQLFLGKVGVWDCEDVIEMGI